MALFNHHWIGLDGKPITGRVPTRIVVPDASVTLTARQRGAVAHAYKLFCDAVQFSANPDGYHVQNRTFPDGTRLRMQSLAGVHQVFVWPTGHDGDEVSADGGFLFIPVDGPAETPNDAWPTTYMETVNYTVKLEPGQKSGSKTKGKTRKMSLPAIIKKYIIPKYHIATKREAGKVSWCGDAKPNPLDETDTNKYQVVIGYDHGLETRYRLYPSQNCSGGFISDGRAQSGNPGIYVFGVKVDTKYRVSDERETDLNVVGAGVFRGTIFIISHIHPGNIGEDNSDPNRVVQNSKTASVFFRYGGTWKLAGSYTFDWQLKAPWNFEPRPALGMGQYGLRAVSIKDMNMGNQELLTLTVSGGTNDPNTGEPSFTVSASETSLGSTPFIAYQVDISPPENEPQEPAGWRQPGEWQYYSGGQLGSHYMDAIPGSDLSGVHAQLLAWAAEYLTPYNGITYAVWPWRINDVFPYILNLYDQDWYKGFFVQGELYAVMNEDPNQYSQVMGSSSYALGRDTRYVIPTGRQKAINRRDVHGRRYVAADFGFDGNLKYLTLTLKSDGSGDFKSCLQTVDEYEHESVHRFLGVMTLAEMIAEYGGIGEPKAKTRVDRVTRSTHHWTLHGRSQWVYEINGEQILNVDGGVKNGGSMDSSMTLKVTTVGVDGGYEVSTPEIENYSPPSGKLVSERGWLMDVDLRSGISISQKASVEFSATKIDFADDPYTTYSLIAHRLMYSDKKCSAFLTVKQNGTTIHEEVLPMPTYDGQEGLIRPIGAHLTLAPRVYDPDDLYEEDILLFMWKFHYYGAIYEVFRHWLVTPWDWNPRVLKSGQLQTRDEFQSLVSASSHITYKSSKMGGDVANHPLTFFTKSFFTFPEGYDIDSHLPEGLHGETDKLPENDKNFKRRVQPTLRLENIKAT